MKENQSVSLKQGLEESGFSIVGVCETYDITEIEKVVKEADVIVFATGERSRYESGEARSKHNLQLCDDDKICFERLLGFGNPIVSLVFAGRPLIVNTLTKSNALVYAWHLGQRSGSALAKLLQGEENFSAKLSVTIPRAEGQIPIYYNRKNVGRPFLPENQEYAFQTRYFDGENYPQYPFGYGLSYSKFHYDNLTIDKPVLRVGERATISVDIVNESEIDGVEIVQLYIRDEYAEAVRPVRELKGFQRVHLQAGERKTVSFTLDEKALSYYHIDGEFTADSGEFTIYVGKDSTAQQSVAIIYEKD
jgi:beta-glucosidase